MKTSNRSVVVVGTLAAAALITGSAQADLIQNGGFETWAQTTGTLPDGYGYWRGDWTSIVGAEQDINPWEGTQMLRFDYAHRSGPTALVGSELWQIIDVSEYQSLIRSGRGVFEASSYFNRVGNPKGGGDIDTLFSLGVYAYSGTVDSFPSQWSHSELGFGLATLFSDPWSQSWEQLSFSIVLPEATDFVAVRLNATENVFNDITGQEFHGHYADGATFNIVPAPSALLCLAPLGVMGIGRRRRSA